MPNWLFILLMVSAIIIILVIVVSMMANILFERNAKKDVNQLFNDSLEMSTERVKKEDLVGLPIPVQKWLENANIVGKERISSVRLKQKGRMRTKADGPWMPIQAEQYFRADKPGFVWIAKVKMASFLRLS
ncbi:MAG: hypothetical protein K6T88_04140 [Bacillus sp. (in: Bacteria)]|nr:hypothetical protein [Bacillus sp. (in: firmicutes)]